MKSFLFFVPFHSVMTDNDLKKRNEQQQQLSNQTIAAAVCRRYLCKNSVSNYNPCVYLMSTTKDFDNRFTFCWWINLERKKLRCRRVLSTYYDFYWWKIKTFQTILSCRDFQWIQLTEQSCCILLKGVWNTFSQNYSLHCWPCVDSVWLDTNNFHHKIQSIK